MITTAALLAAYQALAAVFPTYWFNQLAIDSDGALVPPSDAQYFILRIATDPATHDLDGEAYSRPVLTVQAWATSRGAEWGTRDAAHTALVALGWERLATQTIPSESARYGLTTDYERTA